MAKIVQEVEVRGDTKQAQRSMKDLEGSVTKGMIKAQVAIAAATKAFQVLVDVGKTAVENALEYERTQKRLGAALASQGIENIEKYNAVLDAQSTILQEIAGISDETIRDLQSSSLAYGVAVEEVDAFVRASIALGNATGKDASTGMQSLINAQNGLIDRTAKAIPGMKDLTKEQLANGEAVSLILESYGEFVEIGSEGMTGALQSLSLGWDDLTESIGLSIGQNETFQKVISQMGSGLSRIGALIGKQGLWNTWSDLTTMWWDGGEAARKKADQIEKEVKQLAESTGKAEKATAKLIQTQKKLGSTSGGGIQFDEGGFGKDMVMVNGILMPKSDADRIAEESDQWRQDMEDADEMARKRRLAAGEEATRTEIAQREEAVAKINAGVNLVASHFETFLVDLMSGSEDAGQKFAAAMIGSIGQQLFAQGVAHMAQAAAIAWVPGLQGNAAGLAAAAAVEMATGAALQAGSIAMAPSSSSGGGGSGGEDSGSSGFGGGAAASSGGSGDGGGKTVIINVSGAVTAAEAGVQIKRSLDEANKQGLL